MLSASAVLYMRLPAFYFIRPKHRTNLLVSNTFKEPTRWEVVRKLLLFNGRELQQGALLMSTWVQLLRHTSQGSCQEHSS
jgi:hypothetical protein